MADSAATVGIRGELESPMLIAGLKLTQSGGLALLDDDKLLCNIEQQKVGNGRRYGDVEDLDFVVDVLDQFGYRPQDVDTWVLDGWDGARASRISVLDHGRPQDVVVAPYRETDQAPEPGRPARTGEMKVGGRTVPFVSYVHVASHLAAAYTTSPFAEHGEPAFGLVWDGGCFPRLYFLDSDGKIQPGGEAFPLIGHFYSMASQYWGLYRRATKSSHVDDLAVAGKVMAYVAKGRPSDDAIKIFQDEFFKHFEEESDLVRDYRATIIGCGSTGEPSHSYVHRYIRDVKGGIDQLALADEDVLASVHAFLEGMLRDRIPAKMEQMMGPGPWNLCSAGGCALNIKWNSALRAHPAVKQMWVPPFPDDSGSAIGTAALQLGASGGLRPINWHSRLGPWLQPTPHPPAGWEPTPCRPEELARILCMTGEPVVFLHGRAELGPRALGSRSIIAPAVDPAMKDRLNVAKSREYFRPVAPICLTAYAPEVFDPGTPDPYMVFEHAVRPAWAGRIPAVIHLDGTARLQTVSAEDDPVLEAVLREYHKWTGIPVLCNTSANDHGRSFFPDARSAMEWGRIDMVWAEDVLYRRTSGPAS